MSDAPVVKRLFAEPYSFDFFQAVRLLGRMPEVLARAEPNNPSPEAVRFRSLLSLSFPASQIYDLKQPSAPGKLPVMTVTFLGLFGPSGVLPRQYTMKLLELEKERGKKPELGALQDWLDLFNHRFLHLFYRAWEKYRFFLPFERGLADSRDDPDGFTRALLSAIGLGTSYQRDRLRVELPAVEAEEHPRTEDLGLLRFAGLLAQRHRNAWGLSVILREYFGMAVEVRQFQGEWLPLEPAEQTRLGADDGNGELGMTAVAGDRVWDVQGKIRIRLGPLRYRQFLQYLPDRAPVPERKAFYLLSQLVRLYVGPEIDFDVQLILRAEDVPACELSDDPVAGPRLGWNCWLLTEPAIAHAEDAAFDGDDDPHVGGAVLAAAA